MRLWLSVGRGFRRRYVQSMRRICLLVLTVVTFVTTPSLAQSAIEHHVWQDSRTFVALSQTAISITGDIGLSGNPSFAEVGSVMQISFGAGDPVELVSEGASWRQWGVSGDKQTAEVFRLAQDPGELLNGTKLCGNGARYLVFSESWLGGGQILEVAVFDGDVPPFDINSDDLCSTFSYLVD